MNEWGVVQTAFYFMEIYFSNGKHFFPALFSNKEDPDTFDPVSYTYALHLIMVSYMDIDALALTGSMIAAQVFYMIFISDTINGKLEIIKYLLL